MIGENENTLNPSIGSTSGEIKSEQERLMAAMDFSQIQQILGENMPAELIPGELGRVRLQNALKNTFGKDFRSVGASQTAMKAFDQQTMLAKELMRLRSLINGGK